MSLTGCYLRAKIQTDQSVNTSQIYDGHLINMLFFGSSLSLLQNRGRIGRAKKYAMVLLLLVHKLMDPKFSCALGLNNDCFFYSFSSVTDPLAVHHMNELFSIHHHISLVGEAWKFLHQVRQTWDNEKSQ